MCFIEPSLCRRAAGRRVWVPIVGSGAAPRHSVLSKTTVNAPKSLPRSFPKATNKEKVTGCPKIGGLLEESLGLGCPWEQWGYSWDQWGQPGFNKGDPPPPRYPNECCVPVKTTPEQGGMWGLGGMQGVGRMQRWEGCRGWMGRRGWGGGEALQSDPSGSSLTDGAALHFTRGCS